MVKKKKKYGSQKNIAFAVSIIAGLITIGLITIYDLLNLKQSLILYLIFSFLVIFVVMYVLLIFLTDRFIIERIRPIYNALDKIKLPEYDMFSSEKKPDVIDEVNKQVVKWAEKKRKEIALLKENEKYRKEFLGNVSHELKTPLFNIQGYILTLIDGGINDEEINIKYLKRAETNLNRLISIVHDLETISKLESGELSLNYEKFNLVEIIMEIYDLHEMRARERNIKLIYAGNPRTPIIVYADKIRIFEVLTNLVINSIIYGKDNGTTTIELHDIGEKILVEVADTGIGISKKDLKRIFERFYRVDKSRSTKLGGTGLGLSIVKHIIEAHNQTITVKSKIGQGTTFSFTLSKHKNN